MAIMFGSARHDEYGKLTGGAKGDSLQKSKKNDTVGEVSMQEFYVHSKGWNILRPKSIDHAKNIAKLMKRACNNPNIGYDQSGRLGIITAGIDTEEPTECDCSSLVRGCVKKATGTDPGNFTTYNEAAKLEATGLFEKRQKFISQEKTPVYNGDVLVTRSKGHTVVVVSGKARKAESTETKTNVKKAAEAAKSYDKKLAGTYTVTAYSLNVRAGAGTDKTVMVSVPKGTRVNCYGYYTAVKDTKWLYVQFIHNNKIYIGFCSSEHLE